jgi:hypothetical protein
MLEGLLALVEKGLGSFFVEVSLLYVFLNGWELDLLCTVVSQISEHYRTLQAFKGILASKQDNG